MTSDDSLLYIEQNIFQIVTDILYWWVQPELVAKEHPDPLNGAVSDIVIIRQEHQI